MKKYIIMAALFVAMGTTGAQAATASRFNDPRIIRDDRGSYHWETVERNIWVPAQRVRGLWGYRIIPGHYELIREQVKVYHHDYRNNRKGYRLPPGQLKKYDRDNNGYTNGGRERDERNDRYNRQR